MATAAVCSKKVVLLLFIYNIVAAPELIIGCFVLGRFVLQYFVSFRDLKSSCWGRAGCFTFVVLNVVLLLSFFDSSSQCHGFVCCMSLWHFLVILTFGLILCIPVIL